jgi:hypothetical protein
VAKRMLWSKVARILNSPMCEMCWFHSYRTNINKCSWPGTFQITLLANQSESCRDCEGVISS